MLSGILATNVTNATVPDGVGVDIYGFNVSDAYSNKTVITSTCAGPTTFDTHVSIFDSCPTDPSGGASVIATNDDDEYCSSTDSGASTSVFGVPKHTNFFYVAVERYSHGQPVALQKDVQNLEYSLALSCYPDVEYDPSPSGMLAMKALLDDFRRKIGRASCRERV